MTRRPMGWHPIAEESAKSVLNARTPNGRYHEMEVFANWHGGGSYAMGDDTTVERFTSLRAAKDALRERYESNGHYKVTFDYVNREAERVYVPCVDAASEMWVYFTNPTWSSDPYPDRIIKFGPRGGVLVETA